MYLHKRDDFSILLRQAADQKVINEAIIEKDYWVTVVLHELQNSEFANKFIFKGGTSLSKGWNLIDRFSDDIDLLLTTPGLGEKAQASQLKKIESFVGSIDGLKLDKDHPDSTSGHGHRTSCYSFPRTNASSVTGMRPYIRLEMSFRAGSEPHTIKGIQSLVGQVIEAAGSTGIAENIVAQNLPIIDPKRTLVEKFFAVYAMCESKKIQGKTRHFYDIFRLLGLQEIQTFLGSEEYNTIKKDVASFSQQHFPHVPVPPGNNLRDSTALNPPAELAKLIADEIAGSDIYFTPPPSFDEILQRIGLYKDKL